MFDLLVAFNYNILLIIIPISMLGILLKYRFDKRKPPLAPEALPLIGHTKLFLKDINKLSSVISNSTNSESPLRFKFPFYELWLVRGPAQIIPVLSNPKTFDFGPMKYMVLKRMLGLLSKVVDVANQDDSGVSKKPLLNSNVAPNKRFNYLERKATHDFSNPSSHAAFVRQFEENLYKWIVVCEITNEWAVFPDLYIFIRDIIFQTTSDAFFGPHLLQQSPQLAQDIWSFDKSIPFFTSGIPKTFNPQAVKVRARCVEAFRKWRSFAFENKTKSEFLPEWNEISGLKCMSLRNEVFEQFEEWDDDSCAASDFAVLFGLTSNIVRATFWFVLETLQSKDLFDDATNEVSSAIRTFESLPYFDQKKILNSPLLQSIYAETLRVYVSVLMLRKTQQEFKLGMWTIPRNQQIAVCNYSEHMNEKLWNPEDSIESHPVTTFWGRRFLTNFEEKSVGEEYAQKGNTKSDSAKRPPRFTGEGLGCKWFPFGFGERMCPGRNFAKHQMLLTFAILSSTFDIELQIAEGWKPKPDMKHFGYGVMPPETQTPFRIRKKV